MAQFNIVLIGQNGRLGYETALFLASLRKNSPNFCGKVLVATPQAGPLWQNDPSLTDPNILSYITSMGAQLVSFENKVFGQTYPHGNKIECLGALPKGQPFVFFDSDTLILDDLAKVPFDFATPSASHLVTDTWPKITTDSPSLAQIWGALYDQFNLDFPSSWDITYPEQDWRRYAYFNAGYFYYQCPHEFGAHYVRIARSIWENPPQVLSGQPLSPWLDQISLPLVLHRLGGGRHRLPAGLLDGAVSYHYRYLALLYARAPDWVVAALDAIAQEDTLKTLLSQYPPFERFLYGSAGDDTRQLYNPDLRQPPEYKIRQVLKQHGLWER